jgi:hypothetical protein
MCARQASSTSLMAVGKARDAMPTPCGLSSICTVVQTYPGYDAYPVEFTARWNVVFGIIRNNSEGFAHRSGVGYARPDRTVSCDSRTSMPCFMSIMPKATQYTKAATAHVSPDHGDHRGLKQSFEPLGIHGLRDKPIVLG